MFLAVSFLWSLPAANVHLVYQGFYNYHMLFRVRFIFHFTPRINRF